MGFLTNLLWTLAKYGFGYVEDELIHPVVYQFSSIQWDKTPIEFYRADELTTYAPSAVFTRGHLIQELSRLDLDDAGLFRELSADFGVVEFAGNFDVPLWAAYRAQQSSRIVDDARVLWHQIRAFRSQEAQERIRMRTERLEEKEFQKWLSSELYVGEEFRTAEALESAREEAIDEQVARKVWSKTYLEYLPTADDENLRES